MRRMDISEDQLRAIGHELYNQLREGSIRLEQIPDQQMLVEKKVETTLQLAGLMLHTPGLTHEFQVAVLHAWQTAGASASTEADVWETHRETFVNALVGLLGKPHGGQTH